MPRALVCSALIAGLLASASASAYTVRESPQGATVRWATDRLEVTVDPSVHEIGGGADEAIAAAFAEWDGVPDAFPPAISLAEGAADELGYRQGGPNRSTVRYAREGAEIAGKALAVTVVTFDAGGAILDADVIVNGGPSRRFGVLGGGQHGHDDGKNEGEGRYDVQAVVTHEVGHVLGLGEESSIGEATMFPTTARGETAKRDLAGDDESGVRSLYVEPAEGAVGASAASCSAGTPARRGGWTLHAIAGAAIAGWMLLRRGPGTRARRAGRAGGTASALALAVAFAMPAAPARVDTAATGPVARVLSVESRWEGGIAVSRVALSVASCEGAGEGCAAGPHDIVVLGGTVDGITQVVGHAAPPRVGDDLPVRWSAGKPSLRESARPLAGGAPN